MDQKSLYELQTGGGEMIRSNNEAALISRDRFITEEISSRIDAPRQMNVAELSIGEGRLTQSLLHSFPNIKLDCIDISTVRIDYVRNMLKSHSYADSSCISFIECNFDTGFGAIKDTSYDFVIALDIMEHVLDVFGFVEHCHRILAKDGLLILRVPNIAYIKHRIRLLFGRLPVTASWFGNPGELTAWQQQYGWDGGHLHLFTVPVLYRLLGSYGFQIETCRDPGTRFEGLRNVLPNLLYSNPLIVARK